MIIDKPTSPQQDQGLHRGSGRRAQGSQRQRAQKFNLSDFKIDVKGAKGLKAALIVATSSVGLMLTPFGSLYWIGKLLGWVSLGIGAYVLLKSSKKRWPNAVAFLLWSMIAVLAIALLTLFWEAASIYVDGGKRLAPDAVVINFANLGADVARELGVVGRILASLLRMLASGLNNLAMTGFGLLAFLVFIVVTALECAPAVLKGSPVIMRNTIKALSQFRLIEKTGNESAATSRLIDTHNNYFDSFLRTLEWARLAAYCFDLVVITQSGAVNLLNGPWEQIRFTFGFSSINYGDVFKVLILLGFFEAIVRITVATLKAYRLSTGKAA